MTLKRQIAALWLVLPAHSVLSLETGCPEIWKTRKIKITYECSNFLAFALILRRYLGDGFFSEYRNWLSRFFKLCGAELLSAHENIHLFSI